MPEGTRPSNHPSRLLAKLDLDVGCVDSNLFKNYSKTIVILILLFLCQPGEALSPVADEIVANSLYFYNVTFAICLILVIVTWIWAVYQIFMILWSFTAFSSREYLKMSQFIKTEYESGKQFTVKEYEAGKAFSSGEFAQFKNSVTLYMKFSTILSMVGVACSVGSLFKSNALVLPSLTPQGFRQDANKAGMFTTGLLSLCMICLAPVMGAKKILSYVEPILRVLKQIPYATWFLQMIAYLWNGEMTFDQFCQNEEEFRAANHGMNVADGIKEGLKEVGELHANLRRAADQPDDDFAPPQHEHVKVVLVTPTTPVDKDGVVITECTDECVVIDGEYVCTEECKGKHEKAAAVKTEEKPQTKSKPYIVVSPLFKNGKSMKTVNFVTAEKKTPQNNQTSEEKLAAMRKDWEKIEQCVDENFVPKMSMDTQCYGDHCVSDYLDFCPKQIFNDYVGPAFQWMWEELKSYPADLAVYFGLDKQTPADMAKRAHEDVVEAFVTPVEITPEGVEKLHRRKMQKPERFEAKNMKLDDVLRAQQRAGVAPEASHAVTFLFFKRYGKILFKGFLCTLAIMAAARAFQSPAADIELSHIAEEDTLEARVQAKGKTKHTVRGGTVQTTRRRRNVWNDVSPSGSENDADASYESDDRAEQYEYLEDKYYDERRYVPEKKFPGQAVRTKVPPPRRSNEPSLRNRIVKSRKPVTAPAHEIVDFIKKAKEAYSKPMKIQSMNVSELSEGIYKFYRCDGTKSTYLCTGTHIGNKMWTVLHALSEDTTVTYMAVNHVRTIVFKAQDMVPFGDHLACFPVNGIPAVFTCSKLKVLEDASIVTVLGFGHGLKTTPDSMTGFASPLGWCNAPTRDGDCTSPVLDCNGNIVGFWTHGIEKVSTATESFGRFERVTSELIDFAKNGSSSIHVGLDFQLRPHSR